VVFTVTDLKPNTNFLKTHFLSSLDQNKQVKVNSYFQMEIPGEPLANNIFAAGDIAVFPEGSEANNLSDSLRHVEPLYQNIKLYAQGKQLRPYKPHLKSKQQIICMGPEYGIVLHYGKNANLLLQGY